jgi:hypothetical protein
MAPFTVSVDIVLLYTPVSWGLSPLTRIKIQPGPFDLLLHIFLTRVLLPILSLVRRLGRTNLD